ncbi:type III pantothenate kinase [Marinomonas sp. GJ51-6]|uniref:type III pantothenate kinase n=1 Tax=Marinomonas sp. GJ51-6 TaxID=2992802 RepID=UPI002934923E|nr:type III pantothenate kinase [Marinomonas sp. GJ51-6]WOD08774.1 type III pantothenate kinase [Marinomonas sp. GJ51-6]
MSAATNVLVIDAGNTSVKFTAFNGGKLLWVVADALDVLESDFVPDAVYFASVRSKDESIVEVEKVKEAFSNCAWLELSSESQACGVTNAYFEPVRLGVDRWLGVIAAHHLYKGDVVIVDAGTAIKVDLVSRDGKHLGGYIVPGLSMMEKALLSNTARIRYSASEVVAGEGLPNSTARAVTEGCHEMALGFLERIYRNYSDSQWVVTGGDGRTLLDLLKIPLDSQPNLVALGAKLVGDELMRGKE